MSMSMSMSGKKILCVVLARKGSKGLLHKNIQPINDIPLLVRAINLIQKSMRTYSVTGTPHVKKPLLQIVVSTDSPDYASLACTAGAQAIQRPAELATDHSPMIDSVIHTLKHNHTVCGEEWAEEYVDAVLLVSVTTPLTQVNDLQGIIKQFFRQPSTKQNHQDRVGIASVCLDHSHPSWRFKMANDVDTLLGSTPNQQVIQRQQGGSHYLLNGALYMATPTWLHTYNRFVVPGKSLGYKMPLNRSLDIECEAHLEYARFLLQHKLPMLKDLSLNTDH